MDDSSYRLMLIQARRTKSNQKEHLRMSKTAKFVVAKCCKMKKIYSPVKFANFVYICIFVYFGSKWLFFPRVMQIYTKQRILQGYIFHILQHFAIKLCNFTHFKMLFPAMVMDSTLFVQIKISSVARIIYYNHCFKLFNRTPQ